MAPLPSEVAEWALMVAMPECDPGYAKARLVSFRGAYNLKIPQLKKILNALKQFPFVQSHTLGAPRSLSYLNKQQLVDLFHRYIFTDESCSTVDPVALQALEAATTALPHNDETNSVIGRPVAYVPPVSAADAAASAAIARQSVAYLPPTAAKNSAGRPVPHVPPIGSPAMSRATSASAFATAATRKSPSKAARKSTSGQKRRLFASSEGASSLHTLTSPLVEGAAATYNPWLSLAASADAGVYVKSEYSLPEDTPRDDQERRLLGALQSMGFTDTLEMLTSIRKLVSQRAPQSATVNPAFAAISAETVMMDIISTREEAEETLKMDEARRQSERSRKEEGEKRRRLLEQQYEQQLEDGTIDAWRADPKMFKSSWILQNARACQVLEGAIASNRHTKMELIALLKLEKLASKWFKELPQAYFVDCLAPRIVFDGSFSPLAENTAAASSTSDAPAWLKAIIESLQYVLYDLNQQNKNNVPFAFLDAHDEWCKRNPGTSDDKHSDSDDDDDCVVVVDAFAANVHAKAAGISDSLAISASPRGSIPAAIDLTTITSPMPTLAGAKMTVPEIIEILD